MTPNGAPRHDDLHRKGVGRPFDVLDKMGGGQSSEMASVPEPVTLSEPRSGISSDSLKSNGVEAKGNGNHRVDASSNGHVRELDSAKEDVSTNEKTPSTLRDRGQIPLSLYVSGALILGLQYSSNMYSMEFVQSWWRSVSLASHEFYQYCAYIRDVCQTLADPSAQEAVSTREVMGALVSVLVVASIVYILFLAPLRAGFWTGKRATSKHVFHRYAGLAYLIQYALAWIEYLTLYDTSAKTSFLPHTIAINGTCRS
jgi:hypothetical protein